MMKKLLAVATTAAIAIGVAAPAASANHRPPRASNLVEVLVQRSSLDGPDRNNYDFDLLIAAALNTTTPDGTVVADLLASTGDLTVWAPNDRAFKRLARQLGWDGSGEADAGAFLLENVDNDTLFTVLAYHVTPGRFPVLKVLRTRTFDTLLPDAKITRHFLTLQDLDPNDRDPRLTLPLNLKAGDGGVIHAIDRVLRPVDLP